MDRSTTRPPLSAGGPFYPFMTAPFLSTNRNTRNARGVVVPVTGSKYTPITVTHNLGRQVQGMIALINNKGQDWTPRLRFAPGANSTSQQAIEATEDMTGCLVWFF